MIPTIGIMIGAYIGFRCIEVLCRNASNFSSRGARTFTGVMAVLTMAMAAYCSLSLISASGSQSPGPGIKTENGVYPPQHSKPNGGGCPEAVWTAKVEEARRSPEVHTKRLRSEERRVGEGCIIQW